MKFTKEDANKELAQYDKLLVIKSNNDNGGGSGSGDAEVCQMGDRDHSKELFLR